MTSRALLLATLMMAPLAAQAQAQTSLPSYTINGALVSDIRSTDPGVNRELNTDVVVQHMVEGLVAYREDASVGPLLAEDWTISPDGATYTFRLRRNVRFHNGATLTAADVLWTWKRFMDPKTQWRCQPEFSGQGHAKVDDISAPDESTVVFKLDKPSALFLPNMARADCGGTAVLHKDSVDASGAWQKPVGTGPYMLGEWKRGEYIELVRFDGYANRGGERDGFTGGKTAYAQKVRITVIPDAAAIRAALLSGAIHMTGALPPSDLDEMRKRTDVVVNLSPAMEMEAFLLQTTDPLLKDPRMRRALAMAIDTEQVAQAVTHGAMPFNPSVIPSGSRYHTAVQKTRIKHDPAGAKALAQEAGYRGQPLKMLATKRWPQIFDAAVLAQAMAKEAGINIELEVLDWAALLDRYTKGDFQLMSFGYSARLDPSLSFDMVMGPKATQPRKVWDDPEAQAMLQKSMSIADPAARQPIFDELHKRFLEVVPMLPIYNDPNIVVARREVSGARAWPMAMARYWGVQLNK
jgi:peptide/nickel transport system substrate-binding protein